jgi:hypothetical protein
MEWRMEEEDGVDDCRAVRGRWLSVLALIACMLVWVTYPSPEPPTIVFSPYKSL